MVLPGPETVLRGRTEKLAAAQLGDQSSRTFFSFVPTTYGYAKYPGQFCPWSSILLTDRHRLSSISRPGTLDGTSE